MWPIKIKRKEKNFKWYTGIVVTWKFNQIKNNWNNLHKTISNNLPDYQDDETRAHEVCPSCSLLAFGKFVRVRWLWWKGLPLRRRNLWPRWGSGLTCSSRRSLWGTLHICILMVDMWLILKLFKVAWKPDGSKLLTASGDKTCKLWDVETRTVISEFNMGSAVDDQQVDIDLLINCVFSMNLDLQ